MHEPWNDPQWRHCTRVHDWRNYISDEVIGLWDTFDTDLRAALYRQANAIAARESWD